MKSYPKASPNEATPRYARYPNPGGIARVRTPHGQVQAIRQRVALFIQECRSAVELENLREIEQALAQLAQMLPGDPGEEDVKRLR